MLLLPWSGQRAGCLWALAASWGFVRTAAGASSTAETDFAGTNYTTVESSIGSPAQNSSGQGRILNGNVAQPGQFPHHAHLIIEILTGGQSFCGGSIISDWWVVTAAHCVSGKVANGGVLVVLGYLIASQKQPWTQFIRSTRVIPHPRYDSVSYDAAMIKVGRRIDLSGPMVRAIRLPDQGDVFVSGTLLTVVGFGYTDLSGSLPNRLLYTQGLFATNAECGSYPGQTLVCGMSLASKGGGTTCPGDSGGGIFGDPSGRGICLAGIHNRGRCVRSTKFYFLPFYAVVTWVRDNMRYM